jgi:hypothetical protein
VAMIFSSRSFQLKGYYTSLRNARFNGDENAFVPVRLLRN